MSILITGGAGYIGSHTTVELLNAGFDVVLVDDFSNSSPAVLERLEKITGKKFPFYQGSILDTDFWIRFLQMKTLNWSFTLLPSRQLLNLFKNL